MSLHDRYRVDLVDHYIRKTLKGWVSGKEPAAESRARLLHLAVSLDQAPAWVRPRLLRSARRIGRGDPMEWFSRTGGHAVLIWFSGELGLLRLRC